MESATAAGGAVVAAGAGAKGGAAGTRGGVPAFWEPGALRFGIGTPEAPASTAAAACTKARVAGTDTAPVGLTIGMGVAAGLGSAGAAGTRGAALGPFAFMTADCPGRTCKWQAPRCVGSRTQGLLPATTQPRGVMNRFGGCMGAPPPPPPPRPKPITFLLGTSEWLGMRPRCDPTVCTAP